jgi:putative flippase GtrA
MADDDGTQNMKFLRGSANPATFLLVGALAAALHWLVAVMLVERAGVAPMLANVGGWLVALALSFVGQWRWTFGDRRAPSSRSALRFFGLSAAGLALNAATYALLLHNTPLRYDIALALVLLTVTVITYLATQRWVFRQV